MAVSRCVMSSALGRIVSTVQLYKERFYCTVLVVAGKLTVVDNYLKYVGTIPDGGLQQRRGV